MATSPALTLILEPQGFDLSVLDTFLGEIRLLTDLSVEEVEAAGFVVDDVRIVPAAPPKKGVKKLSKSDDESWWKLEAFKQEVLYHPVRKLIWVDPQVLKHTGAADNWLDPIGVLEEDRQYSDALTADLWS